MHKSLLALAATAVALAVPATSLAATGGTATKTTPFHWTGGPGQGLVLPFVLSQVEGDPVPPAVSESTVACTQVETCDDTLIKIDESGDLTIDLVGHDGDTPTDDPYFGGADLDLYVYASNAQGTKGEELGRSWNEGAVEQVVVGGAQPGYYLAHVQYYHAVNATYDATATLSDPPPPDDEE